LGYPFPCNDKEVQLTDNDWYDKEKEINDFLSSISSVKSLEKVDLSGSILYNPIKPKFSIMLKK
jgi:hypothetical protein